MIESPQFTNMGFPEGTGKRYSEEDLVAFDLACPESSYLRIMRYVQEATLKYSRLSELPEGKRMKAAVGILEVLLIGYSAEQIPDEVPFGNEQTPKFYVQLPTGRLVVGDQESMGHVKALLGAKDITKEEVNRITGKTS